MEFLKANFELLGINLVDGYTQSIDADQVADETTIFTRAEMLEFVESW